MPHTILEVKMEGRPGSWGPGEGRGLSPEEVRAGALLASTVAWPEEMAEGARQCTPQHTLVLRHNPLTGGWTSRYPTGQQV